MNSIKIAKSLVRIAKSLVAGTGNFNYENACLVVTDDDLENENYPSLSNEESPICLRSYPSYVLDDYNDDLYFKCICMTYGYYSSACIDWCDTDDFELSIERFVSGTGYKLYDDWDEMNEEEQRNCIDKEIEMVAKDVNSDAPFISMEEAKAHLNEFVNSLWKDESITLEEFLDRMDDDVHSWIDERIEERKIEEDDICKKRLKEIASNYGFKFYGTVGRFSNGEAVYTPIDNE